MKKNCWQAKQCGREPRGARAAELGVCPAALPNALNGVHGGWNGGRACWVIAGTLCKGEVQGSFAKKFGDCQKCDFYLTVRQEEGSGLVYASVLVNKLKEG